MSERRDDTPKQDEPSPTTKRVPPHGSYYYDDATGYEIYDPDEDDAEEDEPEAESEAQAKSAPTSPST